MADPNSQEEANKRSLMSMYSGMGTGLDSMSGIGRSEFSSFFAILRSSLTRQGLLPPQSEASPEPSPSVSSSPEPEDPSEDATIPPILLEKFSQGISATSAYRQLNEIPEPEAGEDSEVEDSDSEDEDEDDDKGIEEGEAEVAQDAQEPEAEEMKEESESFENAQEQEDSEDEEMEEESEEPAVDYSVVDFWWSRFIGGNFSMKETEVIGKKLNVFEDVDVQELIAMYSDSLTLATLQQVSRSFRRISRDTLIHISKMKVTVDTDNIKLQVFDRRFRQWTEINYLHDDNGCRYQVGERFEMKEGLNFHRVFISDFMKIVRHPTFSLAELDFDIVETRFPMNLEWSPYKFFKNAAMSLSNEIYCNTMSITVDECYQDTKDPSDHLLNMIVPGFLETIRIRVLKRAWPPSQHDPKFDGRPYFEHKMRRNYQWLHARNLIFESDFYDVELIPTNDLETLTVNNICHNTMKDMVENFSMVPMRNDITINLKGQLLMPLIDLMVNQDLNEPAPSERVFEFPINNQRGTFTVEFTENQILLKRQ